MHSEADTVLITICQARKMRMNVDWDRKEYWGPEPPSEREVHRWKVFLGTAPDKAVDDPRDEIIDNLRAQGESIDASPLQDSRRHTDIPSPRVRPCTCN